MRKFSERDGLPDTFVRALWEDRDGNIWAGTNAGVARSNGERFVAARRRRAGSDMVRCLFEDREGNVWVGSNSGLTRYRDTVFTVYGKSEGLPSDEPNTVFQDRAGRIWAGFHDAGLAMLEPGAPRVFTTRDGLPEQRDLLHPRRRPDGDLLIGARAGFVRMRDGRFTTFVPPDPLARLTVFDALEDAAGVVWLATPGGLGRLRGEVVPDGRARSAGARQRGHHARRGGATERSGPAVTARVCGG